MRKYNLESIKKPSLIKRGRCFFMMAEADVFFAEFVPVPAVFFYFHGHDAGGGNGNDWDKRGAFRLQAVRAVSQKSEAEKKVLNVSPNGIDGNPENNDACKDNERAGYPFGKGKIAKTSKKRAKGESD